MEYSIVLNAALEVTGVRRIDADSEAFIPNDFHNSDWLIYVGWQATQDKYAAYSVDQVKALRIADLDLAVRSFVYTRYPPHRQQTLSHIRSEARFDGLVNRANYVGQCALWINSCIQFFYVQRATIEYMQTIEDVLAVNIDASYLGAEDPEVSIGQAMSIPD